MVKVDEQVRCEHFQIKELVSPWALETYTEEYLWSLFDERLLETLDQIREYFGQGVVVNSYKNGLIQRGLRLNWDPMMRKKEGYYASAHCMGRAVDFHVVNIDTRDVYAALIKDKHKFKHIRRLESISYTKKPGLKGWIHIDTLNIRESFKIFKP